MSRDRLERLTADLDRAFEALEEGRVDDAAAILERCRRIDRTHEGVVELAAAVADVEGDTEGAMENYRALAALRPDDPLPRIAIARLQLHDLGDADAALATLDAAFDFIDDESDLISGIMLRVEAYLEKDDVEAAQDALGELASSVIEDPELALDLAMLAIACEDGARAITWAEAARQAEPDLAADALYVIGSAHELSGDAKAQLAAWQEVRRLDAAAPAPALALDDAAVSPIALATFEALPDDVRARLERVPILLDELPSEALVAEGMDPRMYGVFEGTPLPEGGELAPSPTTIRLFVWNLARDARDADALAEQVRITLLHETAHYFGLDDDDLERIGLG